jgi:hypothetical protein
LNICFDADNYFPLGSIGHIALQKNTLNYEIKYASLSSRIPSYFGILPKKLNIKVSPSKYI